MELDDNHLREALRRRGEKADLDLVPPPLEELGDHLSGVQDERRSGRGAILVAIACLVTVFAVAAYAAVRPAPSNLDPATSQIESSSPPDESAVDDPEEVTETETETAVDDDPNEWDPYDSPDQWISLDDPITDANFGLVGPQTVVLTEGYEVALDSRPTPSAPEGLLCLAFTETTGPPDGPAGAVGGSTETCAPTRARRKLSFSTYSTAVIDGQDYVLGLVRGDATRVDVSTDGGAVSTTPVVPEAFNGDVGVYVVELTDGGPITDIAAVAENGEVTSAVALGLTLPSVPPR